MVWFIGIRSYKARLHFIELLERADFGAARSEHRSGAYLQQY
jgi:hypothetical protein